MLNVATHSGSFHADDVFAFAVLKAATKGELTLTRTRDDSKFPLADVVFDVGGVCDPAKGRYDHHMRNKPLRDDGMPYSSLGLIWRDYGRAAITAQLPATEQEADRVWRMLDDGVIRDIDISDNGALPSIPAHMATVIEAWNPTHLEHEPADNTAFLDAAEVAGTILRRCCAQAYAAVQAMGQVEAAVKAGEDPRIILLDHKIPWEEAVFELGLVQALYVIRPAGHAWSVNAVPPTLGSFEQRKPLPEAWAGLRDAEFIAASGIADATFCHPARFICGAKTRDGALALARKAADQG